MRTLSSHLDGPTIHNSALRYVGGTPPAAAAPVATSDKNRAELNKGEQHCGTISQTPPRRSDA